MQLVLASSRAGNSVIERNVYSGSVQYTCLQTIMQTAVSWMKAQAPSALDESYQDSLYCYCIQQAPPDQGWIVPLVLDSVLVTCHVAVRHMADSVLQCTAPAAGSTSSNAAVTSADAAAGIGLTEQPSIVAGPATNFTESLPPPMLPADPTANNPTAIGPEVTGPHQSLPAVPAAPAVRQVVTEAGTTAAPEAVPADAPATAPADAPQASATPEAAEVVVGLGEALSSSQVADGGQPVRTGRLLRLLL